jgi:hypothetical protein
MSKQRLRILFVALAAIAFALVNAKLGFQPDGFHEGLF